MTITVKAEDLASCDDTVNQCYVLDSGDYTFYLGTVRHRLRVPFLGIRHPGGLRRCGRRQRRDLCGG